MKHFILFFTLTIASLISFGQFSSGFEAGIMSGKNQAIVGSYQTEIGQFVREDYIFELKRFNTVNFNFYVGYSPQYGILDALDLRVHVSRPLLHDNPPSVGINAAYSITGNTYFRVYPYAGITHVYRVGSASKDGNRWVFSKGVRLELHPEELVAGNLGSGRVFYAFNTGHMYRHFYFMFGIGYTIERE